MSEVTLDIGGRHYTIACGEGEEAQAIKLGQIINEKVTAIAGGKQISENQALLFSALMLADELQDAQGKAGGSDSAADGGEFSVALERIAEVLENCAEKLESRAAAT